MPGWHWSIYQRHRGDGSGTKWPTTTGAEDFHVIRFAEVLLIKAEALARQSDSRARWPPTT